CDWIRRILCTGSEPVGIAAIEVSGQPRMRYRFAAGSYRLISTNSVGAPRIMLQVDLKVLEGRQQGKLIPLIVRQFLIGREQDCHLRPNSDLVSRHHCVFTIDDFTARLRDLGSTNGTYVNGERIQGQVVLKPGD